MFALERTKKVMVCMFIISGIAAFLCLLQFAKNSFDLFSVSIMGWVYLGILLIAFPIGLALRAMQKDIAELLEYLHEKRDEISSARERS
jgi:hypothetical protein